MKNIKLVVLTTMTMLFLGMGNVNAQEKTSVIINCRLYYNGNCVFETIKPDYSVEKKETSKNQGDFHVLMKQEMDIWISQGYELVDLSNTPLGTYERTLLVLIKEE